MPKLKKTVKRQQPHLHASPYPAGGIALHWIIALLIVGNLLLGYGLANEYFQPPFSRSLIGFHKSVGVVVLLLAVTRLTYRITHNYPGLVPMPQAMRIAAYANHYALYVLMFWMPLTGFLMSTLGGHGVSFFGLINIPPLAQNREWGGLFFTLHAYGMWALFILVPLHIAAAVYHQLWRQDGTLGRMLPFLQDIGQPAKR